MQHARETANYLFSSRINTPLTLILKYNNLQNLYGLKLFAFLFLCFKNIFIKIYFFIFFFILMLKIIFLNKKILF